MGQFSWLDCKDTRRQILDDVHEDVYLLIPKEFGGGHILETHYDGYGDFGDKDVYDLVADWNKDCIPNIIRLSKNGKWKCSMTDNERYVMECFYNGEPVDPSRGIDPWYTEKRIIGVHMACYDEDNARLDYPIKITHDPYAVYEECDPSPSDPHQGWNYEEDAEE